MPIISKETWDKFDPTEQKEIRELYSSLINVMKLEEVGSQRHIVLSCMQDRYISLFGKENLQPQLTYEDVARELFMGKDCYYIDFGGAIRKTEADYKDYQSAGYYTSVKQAEKLLAINKLLNVCAWADMRNEIDIEISAALMEKINGIISDEELELILTTKY